MSMTKIIQQDQFKKESLFTKALLEEERNNLNRFKEKLSGCYSILIRGRDVEQEKCHLKQRALKLFNIQINNCFLSAFVCMPVDIYLLLFMRKNDLLLVFELCVLEYYQCRSCLKTGLLLCHNIYLLLFFLLIQTKFKIGWQ